MKKLLKFTIVMACGLAAGCQSAPEKHYAIQGEVISVDAPQKLLTVKHGDIPGFMHAMTMTYTVAERRQIETLQPGDKISADLVVSDTKSRLERIELVGESKTGPGTTQHQTERTRQTA